MTSFPWAAPDDAGSDESPDPAQADRASPDPADESAPDEVDQIPPEGPPGGGIFTLEGRRAPGLYLAAWVISLVGFVLALVIGPLASDPDARTFLLLIGSATLTIGLATACGYQALERRARDPEAYRGPAPLLVFATYFFAMWVLGILATASGVVDLDDAFGFFVLGSLQTVGYAVAVWLLVVRTSGLSWAQMGWPTWAGSDVREALRGIGTAVAVMLPVTFGLGILGGLLALLLGVEAPDILPSVETSGDALAVALAVALIVPIGEELFFRGFALTAWRRDLGERAALIRTSVFFALIHIVNIEVEEGSGGWDAFLEGLSQALVQTVVILPLGFVLGWLFLRRGMAAAIGGHVTYNGLLLFLAAMAANLPEPT